MKIFKTLAILAIIILTGCSHTELVRFTPDYDELYNTREYKNFPNPLNSSTKIYKDNDNRLKEIKTKLFFTRGKYSSLKDDSEPLTSTRLTLVHSYDFYPSRPLNDILFEGIKSLIEKSGHQWDTTETKKDIRVDVKYLSFGTPDHYSKMIGYDAQTMINVRIEFYDNKKDILIYGNNYYGTNTNIYGDPDETRYAILTEGGDGVKRIESATPDITLRYGNVENKTFHKAPIGGSFSANWDLFYESAEFSLINLLNKVGSDSQLKSALEMYLSNDN
ncbi:MAG: hypothetical protein KF721_16025 [Ignavibacteriaceae bacterium]|nr:hypothetical protein [Ignavibacteriaceae bacterium]